MKKKWRKNCISNSSIKSINSNKYNKITISRILPDLTKVYKQNDSGWIKLEGEAK